ncbi:FAD-binding protein [Arthrobacter glacialis]|uniref:FAD-binding protein n=1 Tax=Arthrobacter glacialis TaxID=1664 RepID=A0A2S3ZRL9_ARTGL|nr:FAD-binding protein [Arthrobacter glacialis]POH71850.1 FAD-binding protein [Arthrobacter glacialis]
MAVQADTIEWNWAGNYSYGATTIHQPTTLEELRTLVAGAAKVRALGSRHSFNSLADTDGVLVNLSALAPDIRVDAAQSTVTVSAGTTYGILAAELKRQGYALHNLASLPHISIAGAIATATHGSGDGNGNLATAVVALQFMDAAGELHNVTRQRTPDFAAYVVGLGLLGIVTEVTLQIEADFKVAQHVYTELPWDAVLAHFDEVTSRAYSVSLFTDWRGDTVGQVWFKQRLEDGRTGDYPASFLGGTAATFEMHPLPGVSAVNCTPQLGIAGQGSDRLSHFRMDFLPSSGNEIQSEYLLPREHAVAAINAMRELSATISPLLLVAEIRTIAADDLWLSPNYGRDGIGLHFTWRLHPEGVQAVLPLIEEALAPFAARPHWGKVFAADAVTVVPLYPKLADFLALAVSLDPGGKFRNDFLDRTIFGGSAGTHERK